jgi:hypothetical protein
MLMINASIEKYENEMNREDHKTALFCTVIVNAHGANAKIEDFLPKKKKSKMTWQQYELALRQSTVACGGEIIYK